MRVGEVGGLWRYPVKSMRGERLATVFAGFAGIYGDRICALRSTASPAGFPFLTGRTQPAMLRYQPRFRNHELAARPPGLLETEQLAPGSGLTTVYPDLSELQLEVSTPEGDCLSIDDPALLTRLRAGIDASNVLSLIQSQRALTDCRPVSLISLQTVRQIEQEVGVAVDPRRFRANLYIELAGGAGFDEDGWVGRTVRVGTHVTLEILKRDQRCKMITLDPETGVANPAIFKQVQHAHECRAGVYAAVLAEGLIHQGDALELIG